MAENQDKNSGNQDKKPLELDRMIGNQVQEEEHVDKTEGFDLHFRDMPETLDKTVEIDKPEHFDLHFRDMPERVCVYLEKEYLNNNEIIMVGNTITAEDIENRTNKIEDDENANCKNEPRNTNNNAKHDNNRENIAKKMATEITHNRDEEYHADIEDFKEYHTDIEDFKESHESECRNLYFPSEPISELVSLDLTCGYQTEEVPKLISTFSDTSTETEETETIDGSWTMVAQEVEIQEVEIGEISNLDKGMMTQANSEVDTEDAEMNERKRRRIEIEDDSLILYEVVHKDDLAPESDDFKVSASDSHIARDFNDVKSDADSEIDSDLWMTISNSYASPFPSGYVSSNGDDDVRTEWSYGSDTDGMEHLFVSEV